MNFSPRQLLSCLAIVEIAAVLLLATTQSAARPIPIPPTTQTLVIPTSTLCPLPFTDLRGNNFAPAIQTLYCRGLISGTDSLHYQPATTTTRAQFAKEVVLGFGLPLLTPSQPHFSDVHSSYFAYTFIESGYAAGILSGFDANACHAALVAYPCYRPNQPITRAQLTNMAVASARYPLLIPAIASFRDVPPNNVFYAAVETAYAHHLISGYPGGRFRPGLPIRRDEMAQIISQTLTRSASQR